MGEVIDYNDFMKKRIDKLEKELINVGPTSIEDLHFYAEDLMNDIVDMLDSYEFIYDNEDGTMMDEMKIIYFAIISMLYRIYTEADNEPNELLQKMKEDKKFEKLFFTEIKIVDNF